MDLHACLIPPVSAGPVLRKYPPLIPTTRDILQDIATNAAPRILQILGTILWRINRNLQRCCVSYAFRFYDATSILSRKRLRLSVLCSSPLLHAVFLAWPNRGHTAKRGSCAGPRSAYVCRRTPWRRQRTPEDSRWHNRGRSSTPRAGCSRDHQSPGRLHYKARAQSGRTQPDLSDLVGTKQPVIAL